MGVPARKGLRTGGSWENMGRPVSGRTLSDSAGRGLSGQSGLSITLRPCLIGSSQLLDEAEVALGMQSRQSLND